MQIPCGDLRHEHALRPSVQILPGAYQEFASAEFLSVRKDSGEFSLGNGSEVLVM